MKIILNVLVAVALIAVALAGGAAGADDRPAAIAGDDVFLCCDPDLNCDGFIDELDLAILLDDWGPCFCDADFNEDLQVGPDDLAQLLAMWGPCQQ